MPSSVIPKLASKPSAAMAASTSTSVSSSPGCPGSGPVIVFAPYPGSSPGYPHRVEDGALEHVDAVDLLHVEVALLLGPPPQREVEQRAEDDHGLAVAPGNDVVGEAQAVAVGERVVDHHDVGIGIGHEPGGRGGVGAVVDHERSRRRSSIRRSRSRNLSSSSTSITRTGRRGSMAARYSAAFTT